MWQQHNQTAHTAPFLLAGGDELVDNNLRTVGEVAELRFPDGQRARLSRRVTVFECQNRFFRQYGVPHLKYALPVMHVLQRSVGRTVRLVMNYRVTVEEGAATSVFAGQTDWNAFIDQRGVRQVFRAAPIEQLLARRHRLTVAVDFRYARLHFDGFWYGTDTGSQLLQALHLNFVRVAFVPLMVEVWRPGKGVQVHRTPLFHHAFARVQRVAIQVDHLSGIFQRRDFVRFQLVSIDFTRGRMLFDFLVHQRLGCAWLVGFVVAVTAVAHQVDEHIAFKGVTEVQRQTGDESNGFRVIRIHVEDWRHHHLTDIGAIWG